MDKNIRVGVRTPSSVCNVFTYGPGGILHLPTFVCFNVEDAGRLEKIINEALEKLPIDRVDEWEEWKRLSA